MSAKKKASSEKPAKSVSIKNRKARFHYHILESYEAGIVLTGSEIKSIRRGKISLEEAYVRPMKGEIFLLGAHIPEYDFSKQHDYDPLRPRKLLMHRHEIDKLRGRVEQKGLTIVPLAVYLKRGKAKVEIALAKGKDAPDKRKTIRDREVKRDLDREMKRGK